MSKNNAGDAAAAAAPNVDPTVVVVDDGKNPSGTAAAAGGAQTGARGKTELKGLTNEQIEEFRLAFSLFDADGGGTIAIEELAEVMRALGQQVSDTELQDMIREVDEDESGELDFEEFLNLMAKKLHDSDSEVEITEAFRVFDKDNSGTVPISVIVATLSDHKVIDSEIDELINAAKRMAKAHDDVGDGTKNVLVFHNNEESLRYEGFVKLMLVNATSDRLG